MNVLNIMDNWNFNFGKHKGKTFEEIYTNEKGYTEWILNLVEKEDKTDNKTFNSFVEYVHKKRNPKQSLIL